ncbi:glycosyl transferase [Pseudodesulfovibrio nedwellii]|uniref:Glycosyl transferase n=1 Tax=Pseudodesulfovibrio nedwellii TaxID=2973072 RepID=A0ABM8B3R2_9BACT|nr:glycosyltransferase family 2 protein [Pseudodesulfovibrio nedwellii]BDQ38460.1 glycosyl transferase [Pseudodesulfovibrio nedwellii]
MKNGNLLISHSLVIPVYGNEENIPHLVLALQKMARAYGESFEVVFVIDGSPDNSLNRILELADGFNYKTVSHSRNFGSFVAIRTGIEHAEGKYIAVMAADLQEPPHLIEDFFKILEADEADLVFGRRIDRNDPILKKLLSNVYWWFYKKVIEPDLPKGGVDIFACTEEIKKSLLKIEEPNSSLIAQLFWLGYRREFVSYVRQERQHGTSAWGLGKRIRYMIDSVFSYTDLPIMLVLWLGLGSLTVTTTVGIVTIVAKFAGLIAVQGYTAIVLLILFLGSLIITIQGVIGCYLWRTFENTKKRPISLVRSVEVKHNFKKMKAL